MKKKYESIALFLSACLLVTVALVNSETNKAYADTYPPVDKLDWSRKDVYTIDKYTYGAQSNFDCMVEAIYYEAGNQPLIGKIAVAQVVLNRVRSKRYPNTVCDVVHQGPKSQWWLENHGKVVPIKHKCQFSYYCDGKEEAAYEGKSWNDSEHAATMIINNSLLKDITDGATHYHADYVSPYWSKTMTRTFTIDNHLFFKR